MGQRWMFRDREPNWSDAYLGYIRFGGVVWCLLAIGATVMAFSFSYRATLAARCELDSQGRALIPQNLRDYAGLVKNVTVLGCNNHAELWDSENWAAVYSAETTPENIAAVMEELEF